MNQKTKLILVFMFFCGVTIFAQDSYLLKGTVVSAVENAPLPGVNVIISNTSSGVSTDFDGNYQIQVKSGDLL
jgi:hypothetical protein